MSDFPTDGRTPGIAMVLELVVGMLLKESSERRTILELVQTMISRFEDDMHAAVASGDTDKYLYLSAFVSGAEDTLGTLKELSNA
ncbi:hypothetical protein ACK9YZ_01210 [Rhizobium sp. ZK1]|uniref:hypothetical protein n=1 Tax=Rhizobium sp. ZK1 TaxID=3389872 RepID=UPI0039F715FE